ncbi:MULTISPECIES: hypothetical protein [unclassified Pseudomonas]|uniref:PA0061/PA0062 family lipoprotein n=1 Tax=unclassified Pseudomonas TaxID=196821 RepID=UPI002AC9B692|nr:MULTISPECIES: hypothetical protein [unclassified Pseudomonas]MEB0046047.1 hypothetical protein [Pseudomonas sp. Dout3]MEB0097307.1 hypothetical protein [Pseudomonas sp. DC1.2]WPX59070.1 hypothetical protein RHM68_26415 [Pseudomonas sp. DC1.2]
MRRLLLLLTASVISGCLSPLPAVNPQMAWVDFSTPTPGGKVLMAERLDHKSVSDGRYFEVTPGKHELLVRFDFEVFGIASGLMNDPAERLCYMTITYDHFEAGQRYSLEGRSLSFTPSARLYNAKHELIAEDREVNCVI